MIQGISNLARYVVLAGKVEPFMLDPKCANSAVCELCGEPSGGRQRSRSVTFTSDMDDANGCQKNRQGCILAYADSPALSLKVLYITIDYLALPGTFSRFLQIADAKDRQKPRWEGPAPHE